MNYFFEAVNKTIPPRTIIPTPIRGDQLTSCPLSALISTLPISTIFSLVKNLKVVKMVSSKPITRSVMPVAFIIQGYECKYLIT